MMLLKIVQETESQINPNYRNRRTDNLEWNKLRDCPNDCGSDNSSNNESEIMKLDRAIKMVLASSSKLFLEGIGRILESESNIKIVAEASTPQEVEKYLTEIRPNFLFLDNRTLDLDICKLSSLITRKSPSTKVILFGDHTRDGSTSPNFIYMTKATDSLELIQTIKSIDKGVLTKKVSRVVSTKHELTKMEERIIDLIADCLSNKEIAKKLSISEKTVKSHLTNIFMKLGLENRYQLIVYARKIKRGSM